jgi:hypothetical protein
MSKIYHLSIFFFGLIVVAKAQEPIVLYPNQVINGGYFGENLAAYNDVIAIRFRFVDSMGVLRDAVRIYRRLDGEWVEESLLIDEDDTVLTTACFGCSMSIYENYLLIGSHGDDENGVDAGAAFVYEYANGEWVEIAKITPSDASPNQGCGNVFINEDYLMVGCASEDANGIPGSGSVYIFKKDGEAWIEQTKLVASDATPFSGFGGVMSIMGDYAFVGSIRAENELGEPTGAVYVFKNENEEWIEIAKLFGSDAIGGFFHVLSNENTLLVGGRMLGENNYERGIAYLFKKQGEDWVEVQKLIPSIELQYDLGLKAIDLDGNYIALSNADNIENATIHIFKKAQNSWAEVMTISRETENIERFGHDLALANNRLIVGAWQHYYQDSDSIKTGAVYIYDLDLLVGSDENILATTPLLIRPNPSQSTVQVLLNVERPTAVRRLELYDARGRLVQTIASDGLARRQHEWSVELGGLPAGYYVLRGISDEQTFVGRLLKM